MYGRFVLLTGLCLLSLKISAGFERPGKIIIDTDGGADDASAILLTLQAEKLLKNEGVKVMAITCTYGNTAEINAEINVLKILTIANRSDIPVYAGAQRPLVGNYSLDFFHGIDGLGDFDFGTEIMGKIDRTKHASVALTDLAREHAGDISIIVLGPLTNVAVAMTLDPKFVDNVRRFYIMGASVHGMGNIAPSMEFNFYQDPVSNFIVLNKTRPLPNILLPWETIYDAGIPMTWRVNVLGSVDSPIIKFLNKAESKSIQTIDMWETGDLLLIALSLWPNLIKRTIITNVTPVYDGPGQGSVLVDYRNRTGKWHNVEILEAFDVENFKKFILHAFSSD